MLSKKNPILDKSVLDYEKNYDIVYRIQFMG